MPQPRQASRRSPVRPGQNRSKESIPNSHSSQSCPFGERCRQKRQSNGDLSPPQSTNPFRPIPLKACNRDAYLEFHQQILQIVYDLKRKCGDDLITRADNHSEPTGRPAVDRGTDSTTEVMLVDLTGSPVRVWPCVPVSNRLPDKLFEGFLGDPRIKLPRALSRTIRPMPFLDMPKGPFGNDYLRRRSGRKTRPALCLYNATARDDQQYRSPHPQN